MTEYMLEELDKPSPDSIIILKFNPEETDANTVSTAIKPIQEKFPDNFILALPEPISLEYFGVENLKKWRDMVDELLSYIE